VPTGLKTSMVRQDAIARATDCLESGAFEADLARRVAMPTVSRSAEHASDLEAYAVTEMRPTFEGLGFAVNLLRHPSAPGPVLLAERIEAPDALTVLQYGHGDVVAGLDAAWSPGLSPWRLTSRDGLWYGRGTADNKGQHSINIAALCAVLEMRGRLGFNAKYLIEMGEESGSLGLEEICDAHREALRADLFVASDGPRLALKRPTVFLGARGGMSFHLSVDARDGFAHSGNWGGLLANPGIELAHAVACLVGPTGQIRLSELVPAEIPPSVRQALSELAIEPAPGDPEVEPWWGEPGLSAPEQVFGWSSLEVMEFACGNLQEPLYAIPPRAECRMQLRFPVGVDAAAVVPAVRRHLDRHDFGRVAVHPSDDAIFLASRLDPDHPWVRWVSRSIEATLGEPPAILPNLGGSLPNIIFSDRLGLPTIWIPHSYPGCRQHAVDEHLPVEIAREGLALMAGLYWDLGEARTVEDALAQVA
jgi:acetylornithine deacetylase/succinyl-diaminopimelate desuccinylase-like protein